MVVVWRWWFLFTTKHTNSTHTECVIIFIISELQCEIATPESALAPLPQEGVARRVERRSHSTFQSAAAAAGSA